jgi:hypothetical protein
MIVVWSQPGVSLQDPISKKSIMNKEWWSGSRCRPLVQAPLLKKKKKRRLPKLYEAWMSKQLNLSPDVKILWWSFGNLTPHTLVLHILFPQKAIWALSFFLCHSAHGRCSIFNFLHPPAQYGDEKLRVNCKLPFHHCKTTELIKNANVKFTKNPLLSKPSWIASYPFG